MMSKMIITHNSSTLKDLLRGVHKGIDAEYTRGDIKCQEAYGVVISIPHMSDITNEIHKNFTSDEKKFLEHIINRATVGTITVDSPVVETKKFARYYNMFNHLRYDLSSILYKEMTNIVSFIRSKSSSRRFYIPLTTENGFCSDDSWPPSVMGIQFMNIADDEVNMTIFTRSSDVDFLKMDIIYFKMIAEFIENVICRFHYIQGINIRLITSNLYKEIKDEKNP